MADQHANQQVALETMSNADESFVYATTCHTTTWALVQKKGDIATAKARIVCPEGKENWSPGMMISESFVCKRYGGLDLCRCAQGEKRGRTDGVLRAENG